MERIKFVKIEADNNYDFGFKLGKALRSDIQHRLARNKEFYKKKSYSGKDFKILINKSNRFLHSVKKHLPNLLIEAKAMAEGAQVSFEELFVLMCDEEIVDFKVYASHCTSVALKTKEGILFGHDEDWFVEYKNDGLFLVNGRIKDNRFLAMGYMGNLPGSTLGFNKHGIAFTDNSLFSEKPFSGVPRSFHLRGLLDAKNPNEAFGLLKKWRGVVSNTTLIFKDQGLYAFENLENKDRIIEGTDCIIHTNHPLEKEDQSKDNTFHESLVRYKKVNDLILRAKEFNIDLLKKILKNHSARICGHGKRKNQLDNTITVASIIMNPKKKWMMVCDRNPCKGTYQKFKL
jgi:predicted choloylglycine hydrolase